MNNNLLKIKKLQKILLTINCSKCFKKFNLNLEMGKIVALIGPSGSGKSTFSFIALLDKPTMEKLSILGKETFNITENKKTNY